MIILFLCPQELSPVARRIGHHLKLEYKSKLSTGYLKQSHVIGNPVLRRCTDANDVETTLLNSILSLWPMHVRFTMLITKCY